MDCLQQKVSTGSNKKLMYTAFLPATVRRWYIICVWDEIVAAVHIHGTAGAVELRSSNN